MKLLKILTSKYEAALARNSAKAIKHNDELIDLVRLAIAILPDDQASKTIKMLGGDLIREINA